MAENDIFNSGLIQFEQKPGGIMNNLENKVAWITGSGRGIGKAIAQELGCRGARLVIHDIDRESAEKTAASFNEKGYPSIALVSDVSDKAEAIETVDRIKKEFGSLDILVNNAGITRDNLLVRMKEDDWDLVMQINLKGTFLCTQASAKLMMKQRSGRIINIVSVVGVMGNPGQSNYAASKAGMIGFTKSSAKELSARGITVNAVAPGYIETEMTAVLPENVRSAFIEATPLKRGGTPADVAKAVAFFAGPESAFITGQVLHVDGGMVM